MLDIRKIKENPDAVKAGLRAKEVDCDATVDRILELDVQIRGLKTTSEGRTAQKNKLAKENGKLFGMKKGMEKKGEDVSAVDAQIEANKAEAIALDAANALIEDCAIAWPAFTFTKKEQRVIEDCKSDIDKYVASMRDAWIMGTAELNDETWEQFVSTVQNMGIQDVLEVYGAALQRAYENGLVDGYHTMDEFK